MKFTSILFILPAVLTIFWFPRQSLCQEDKGLEIVDLDDLKATPRLSIIDNLPAAERLDLFPALRTFIRVMRMINRRDALERMKDGVSRILVRRGQQTSGFSLGGNVAGNRFKKLKMIRRLVSIVGSRDKNQQQQIL